MLVNGKEVEIKEIYTRGIDKEFNRVLFDGVKTKMIDGKQEFDIPPMNIQNANDYIVKAMTNLSESEVDDLSVDDYATILEKITEIKNGVKSKEKNS